MTDAVLAVRDLAVSYGDRPVLDGLSLDVRRGEVLGVVGESGGGKTTLALALVGAVPAPGRAEGSVTFRPVDGDPVDVLSLSSSARRRFRGRRVAVVAADDLPPGGEVGEYVASVSEANGAAAATGRDRAARLLRRLGHDPDRVLGARPETLDGGARWAALAAAAVAPGPAVLVLDSPPAQFDALARRVDAGALAADFGLTLVLVGGVRALSVLADRLAVLYGGDVVETGTPAALRAESDHPFTRRLFRLFEG